MSIVARLMATPVNLDDFLAEVKGVGFHLDSNVKSPLLYLGYSRNAIYQPENQAKDPKTSFVRINCLGSLIQSFIVER
jgi:hypothetical protein